MRTSTTPIKSVFSPIKPKVDATLRTKLAPATSPPTRSAIKQAAGSSNGSANLPALSPQKRTPLPAGPPISVPVELWIEVFDDPRKFFPAFAFISPGQDPPGDTGALNQGCWAVCGAP